MEVVNLNAPNQEDKKETEAACYEETATTSLFCNKMEKLDGCKKSYGV